MNKYLRKQIKDKIEELELLNSGNYEIAEVHNLKIDEKKGLITYDMYFYEEDHQERFFNCEAQLSYILQYLITKKF